MMKKLSQDKKRPDPEAVEKKKPDPEAEQPQPSGDWKQTIRKALAVQRPQGGFPKQNKGASGPPPKTLRRPRGRSR